MAGRVDRRFTVLLLFLLLLLVFCSLLFHWSYHSHSYSHSHSHGHSYSHNLNSVHMDENSYYDKLIHLLLSDLIDKIRFNNSQRADCSPITTTASSNSNISGSSIGDTIINSNAEENRRNVIPPTSSLTVERLTKNSATVVRQKDNYQLTSRELVNNVKIAYVFAGSARSFTCPKVHWSIRSHLIDALGGEPFVFVRISTEDNRNVKTGSGVYYNIQYDSKELNETLKVLNPREVEYFTFQGQEKEMNQQYPGKFHDLIRKNDKRRYSMYFHRSMAYKMVQRYEQQHGVRFDWVMLTRLDAQWLEPILPVTAYANDRVWITETGYDYFNDQFMMIPRKYSDYMYDLNTKVHEKVYCLGGPDVEQWKCKAEELKKRNIKQEEIEYVLGHCCKDRLIGVADREGTSERLQYRHLRVGQIPISMGRFPVFLVRVSKANPTLCRPECFRISAYNYKAYMFISGTSVYPHFAQPVPHDSRSRGISSRDENLCLYQESQYNKWNPASAFELTQEKKNPSGMLYNYQRNLYLQEGLPYANSLFLNPRDLQMWRIHPTLSVNGCLGYSKTTKLLEWQECFEHNGRYFGQAGLYDPNQLWILYVLPHSAWDLSFYSDPNLSPVHKEIIRDADATYQTTYTLNSNISSLVYYKRNASDSFVHGHTGELPQFTRVMIPQRSGKHLGYDSKMLCLTAKKLEYGSPVLLEECHHNPSYPNQLFNSVRGIGQSSHQAATVGVLQLAGDSSLCFSRGETRDTDYSRVVVSNTFKLMKCAYLGSLDKVIMEFELVSA